MRYPGGTCCSSARTTAPASLSVRRRGSFGRRISARHGLFLVAGIPGITEVTIREVGVFEEGVRFEVRGPAGGW